MSDWQTIRTAPCHRPVLVWSPDNDIEVMRHSGALTHWYRSGSNQPVHPGQHPTHWQELPEPPKED